MSKLTRHDVMKLAALSKLRLSDQEVESLKDELSQILDFVEVLDRVETDGLTPTYQVTGLKNVMREDKERDYGYQTKELLKGAEIDGGQFKVKRVL